LIKIGDFISFLYSQGGFAMKDDFDPGIAFWKPFLERFSTMPKEDKLAIIEEYEESEREGRKLNIERMLTCLNNTTKNQSMILNSPRDRQES
jgi:hypothetical protein